MGYAAGFTALLAVVLLWDAIGPALARGWRALRHRPRGAGLRDPLGTRAAERAGREILEGLLDADDRAMYAELGHVRVQGRRRAGPPGAEHHATISGASYAYLVSPHRPVVAYLPQTGTPIAEYRMPRPDRHGVDRLAAADDVVASVLLLRDDEDRLVRISAAERPGRSLARDRVVRDLWRLRLWEAERHGTLGLESGRADAPRAPGRAARHGSAGE